MQIIIESSTENEKIPEWGLLEFQGAFTTRKSHSVYGEFLGDLNYTKDGIPFFMMARNMLYGEEIKLSKPIAVLNKETEENSHSTKYLVKGVIRKKIVFSGRPRPVIRRKINKNNG